MNIDSTMGYIHVCLLCCFLVTMWGLVGRFIGNEGLIFFFFTRIYSTGKARSHWCARFSNSLLQTLCSWATGDILPPETWGRELFLISRATVVLSFCCCFFRNHKLVTFSSQSVLIHSPLISSTVDFVYSSYPAHNYSSSPFGVPCGLNRASSFSFSGVEVVLSLALVCRDRVRKSGVFVTVNSINSVYSLLLCALVWIVCFLPRCDQLNDDDVLLLVRHFVTCVVIFL